MSTFNSRNIVVMPSTPAAADAQFTIKSIVARSESPFTAQVQVQSWNTQYVCIDMTMPPMELATATPWITFLKQCQGTACVFQLPSWLVAYVPSGLGVSTYYEMDKNDLQFSVTGAINAEIVGMHFSINEVISNAA